MFMPHWPKIIGSKPIDLGLERVLQGLERLGNPQNKLPPIIHVAGTNGKGSTIATIQAILNEAGLKTHCYTSPHLVDFNERIVVADKKISDDELFKVMEECRLKTEEINLTFFEATTIGAFLAFSRSDADIVLLETGLGGRLDATNVVNPEICVLTPISMDHMEYLGPNIKLIANEKLGILKKNAKVISSFQYEEIEPLIEKKSEDLGCPLFAYGYDWALIEEDGRYFYEEGDFKFEIKDQSLMGSHQLINISTAIATIKRLNFKISDQEIANGIKNVKWPARLEKITSDKIISKFSPNSEIWLDGAHNEAAALNLSEFIRSKDKKKNILITGMTKGRDVGKFLSFFTEIDKVIGVNVKTEPHSFSAEDVALKAKRSGFNSEFADDVEHALELIPTDEDVRIIICGSLYLASDLYKLIKT